MGHARTPLFTSLFLLAAAAAPGQDTAWWPAPVAAALERSGDNANELRGALDKVPVAQRPGLAFLIEHMPERDLRELGAGFLLENVALAYQVRGEVPWGPGIPDQVFLNDVLPYAHVSETRDPWRREFYERLRPLVKDCRTPGEAAQLLNRKVFDLFGVHYSTKRKRADQSPAESREIGMASCTGLSILLADACRAIGVPARLAGIPRWVNKPGNHTWVEVWDQGWHFTGASEPDGRGLDYAWFQGDAALAQKGSPRHAVLAVSYRPTGLTFPMVWARGADYVHAVDVTDRYAKPRAADDATMRLMVKVIDEQRGERVIAKVRVVDTEDEKREFAGHSRDESADTNDFLTFEVPKGRTWQIQAIARDGREGSLRHETAATDQELVTVPLRDDESGLRAALSTWFAAEAGKRDALTFATPMQALLKRDEPKVRRLAWDAYRKAPIHAEARADFDAHRVRVGGYESPYVVRSVGKQPDGGWPLFIAMHGGGGAPKRVNDSQWRHMQIYYRDQDSVPGYQYLALRAPTDAWNGFYTTYAYPLVAELISQFLLFGDVNPDKVCLMGYSHGGYGAFAIGPQTPDRFAAVHASAAAPTDGVTAGRNLRNTVFTYMIGERDTAYGRADRCLSFAKLIAGLRGDRDDIYPVTIEWKEGYGHGGLPDRDKIKSMYPAIRNATPRELSWHRTDAVVRDFYWLTVEDPQAGQEIEASCVDNRIAVKANTGSLALYLGAELIDFERPVKIAVEGKGTSERTLQPDLRTLCESILRRGDPKLAGSVRVDLAAGN